jgi:hypothetical protein
MLLQATAGKFVSELTWNPCRARGQLTQSMSMSACKKSGATLVHGTNQPIHVNGAMKWSPSVGPPDPVS